MDKVLVNFIRQCNEEFLEENPLDEVDISVVDHYTDYIVDRLEIMLENLKRMKK